VDGASPITRTSLVRSTNAGADVVAALPFPPPRSRLVSAVVRIPRRATVPASIHAPGVKVPHVTTSSTNAVVTNALPQSRARLLHRGVHRLHSVMHTSRTLIAFLQAITVAKS
jgi:hypothetical protein